mgnify:CR=1 FL=1
MVSFKNLMYYSTTVAVLYGSYDATSTCAPPTCTMYSSLHNSDPTVHIYCMIRCIIIFA